MNKKKPSVINYIEKTRENYNDPIKEKIDTPILKNNINSKRYVNNSLNSFENRTENKDVVTFDTTTQLFTDDTRDIAFKTYEQAKRWNDTVNGQPTAKASQVNDLEQRLKRNGFTKPIIEKKKPATPAEPIKINLEGYKPFIPLDRPPKDPEYIRQERNFKQLLENNRREKIKNATTGIAGLVGGDPNIVK